MAPGRGTVLTHDDERALVEHLQKLVSYGYGLTKTQVLHLATDMSDELGRRSAKDKGRLFTKTWFRLFLKRWPKLRLKSPSKLDMNRAKGTTKEALSSYFQELERTMEEYNLKDKPDRIYNVDETNLNAEHKPPKVTTGADTRINSITSHRVGTTSLLACGNAAGRFLPPYYVFKGKQRIPELLSGALPGSKMFMTSSGWSNSTVFRDYLENHFIPALPPRAENEFVMLMYDGHTSHICKPVIEFAREHKIVLFVLPAHTSHVTRPLDVGCFTSLKVSYHAECARYMQENPGEVITPYDIARLSSPAYLRALREKNLKSAFRKAGIFPLEPGALHIDEVSSTSMLVTPEASPPKDSHHEVGPIEDGQQQDSPKEADHFMSSRTPTPSRQPREKKRNVNYSYRPSGVCITENRIFMKIIRTEEERKEKTSTKKKTPSEEKTSTK
ncbi:uncharacterized protein [Diadema setosum]|uniref:uncharacterized protein n=1 Tax=Diadema setosum TaxID=31175 RepID=UPI003B3B0B68